MGVLGTGLGGAGNSSFFSHLVKAVNRKRALCFLKSILLQSENSMWMDLDLGLWIWISLKVHSLCLGVICPVLLCFLVASLILQSIMQHR